MRGSPEGIRKHVKRLHSCPLCRGTFRGNGFYRHIQCCRGKAERLSKVRACHPQAHPLVAELRSIAQRQRVPFREIERRAGIAKASISDWAGAVNSPSILTLDACFRAIGYRLAPVRISATSKDQPVS